MKLVLNTSQIVALTTRPALFESAPFLKPMQAEVFKFHAQVAGVRRKRLCCMKKKIAGVMEKVADGVALLVKRAQAQDPHSTDGFKIFAGAVFKTSEIPEFVELVCKAGRLTF